MGRRALLAEDDFDIAMTVEAMLQAGGYEVTVARSAQEALALLPARFEVAVLDLMMEESDSGVQVAQGLRLHPETRGIPIILLTSAAEKTGFRVALETEEEREWLQVDAWLDKPVTQEGLLAGIEEARRRRGEVRDQRLEI